MEVKQYLDPATQLYELNTFIMVSWLKQLAYCMLYTSTREVIVDLMVDWERLLMDIVLP